ncbi:hypothetical protein [Acetobacter oryzoeni]|uniref:hypothetical protein n=1 Tax=Acetobacter oryzoeni TaxID=2500548 RepID=UPI001FCAA660|nr:hypothetical protein [Acetobacter oryzoeni]MCP1203896.1 hypothetical protein [Acetobacter oryzoeni]
MFFGLEKRAKLAVGLARKIGQRMEREREAERQRQELARQAEIRREMQRQQEIRAAEEARKASDLEPNRPKGLSRGRSRRSDRGYDPW